MQPESDLLLIALLRVRQLKLKQGSQLRANQVDQQLVKPYLPAGRRLEQKIN